MTASLEEGLAVADVDLEEGGANAETVDLNKEGVNKEGS